jgi:hypothetical protein
VRPKIFDLLFNDDRNFVFEMSAVSTRNLSTKEPERNEWAIITRRNVPGYPPYRTDSFSTRSEAVNYYKKIVVETPRVSLGNQSPNPPPSLEDYTAWLVAENLYDPLLNPSGRVATDA